MKVLAQHYVAPSSARPSKARDGSTPYITPRVGKIAQGLFLRSLMTINERVEDDSEMQNICVPDIPFVVHTTAPNEIVWGKEVRGAKGFYESVFVDGIEYYASSIISPRKLFA